MRSARRQPDLVQTTVASANGCVPLGVQTSSHSAFNSLALPNATKLHRRESSVSWRTVRGSGYASREAPKDFPHQEGANGVRSALGYPGKPVGNERHEQ